MPKNHLPELYSEKEVDLVEKHILTNIGEYNNVLHEIVSPDIHVDICVIPPTAKRNYYTLVTMGMGAHKMNVPKQLKKSKLERAEIIVTLPSDWEIQNDDEKWYWPLRWLKILARLPIEHKTWLGYGHTIPNGEPYADNTELSGVMLSIPYSFGEKALTCKLQGGDEVKFYQMLPLYQNEMDYKLQHGAESLEKLFGEEIDMVLNIKRKNLLS